jgi:hypothetical protein
MTCHKSGNFFHNPLDRRQRVCWDYHRRILDLLLWFRDIFFYITDKRFRTRLNKNLCWCQQQAGPPARGLPVEKETVAQVLGVQLADYRTMAD